MKWFAAVSALLQIILTITRMLERRRIIAEAEAAAVLALLEGSKHEADKVRRARRGVDVQPDRVLDDDGFRRD